MLTEEQIDNIQEAAYLKLRAEGYTGSMGGFKWARTSARAIESAVRAEYADVPHEEWNGEGWESLAWHLCAEENGEDACNRQLSGGAKRRPLERPVRRQR